MVKRNNFSKELKLKVLREAEIKPVSEVCRENNVSSKSVYRWRKEQQQYPKEAFKGQGNMYKLEAKLAEKDRLIGQLYAENDLLKKAITSAQKKRAEEKMMRHSR
jgi:transposase